MRRLGAVLIVLVLVFMLAFSVSAADISKMSGFATVSSDSSCQVALTATVHLEQPMDKLYFPVPAEATGVTLNGSRVRAGKAGDVRRVDLSRAVRNVVGDVSVGIHYNLYDVIHTTEAGTMEMRLPLLSGFEYPVEYLEFSVTLPGQIDTLPGFVSGYHQARIEEDLTYTVNGATITGSSLKAMKDHETLTMTLAVTPEMFPQTIVRTQDYQWAVVAMGICGGLALLYWLIAMWNFLILPQSSTEPPHGFHAGQLGAIVAGQGVDLSLAVLSWAQLGYILIQVDKHRHVLLHKRMEMGNERSEAERRQFKTLFGGRNMVDTAGRRYAQLCREAANRPAGMAELLKRWTGNPKVFRALASGIGLFGGAGLAVAMAGGAALQILLIILLGVLGAVSGWVIQDVGAGILLGSRKHWLSGVILGAVWLLVSLMAGAFTLGMWMVLGLCVAGLFLSWGGRRTGLGRQTLAQTLGFKRYLYVADKQQLQRILDTDPDYFFRLAPYAMALGADTAFAKRFGKKKLEQCPYLIRNTETSMTAVQWSALLRQLRIYMDARAQKLFWEKLLGLLGGIIKR